MRGRRWGSQGADGPTGRGGIVHRGGIMHRGGRTHRGGLTPAPHPNGQPADGRCRHRCRITHSTWPTHRSHVFIVAGGRLAVVGAGMCPPRVRPRTDRIARTGGGFRPHRGGRPGQEKPPHVLVRREGVSFPSWSNWLPPSPRRIPLQVDRFGAGPADPLRHRKHDPADGLARVIHQAECRGRAVGCEHDHRVLPPYMVPVEMPATRRWLQARPDHLPFHG